MQKTNKSYSKRIKVTGSKKLVRRSVGQNHFNAKNSGQEGRKKHKGTGVAKADYPNIRKNMPFA